MDSCFPSIIGNDRLKHRLALEIAEGRFPHAYILAGKDGSGKMTLAMQIAAALACKEPHTRPCGVCDSCKKILGGFSPDVLVIRKEDDKKAISVDLIREIKDGLYIAPNELEKRVYIIEHAETMNLNAQNAFLKMLEEPPYYAVFLLLCSNTDDLLDTVKSRAPILYTEALPEEAVRAYLHAHSPRAREWETADPDRLTSVIRSAAGSIGHAMRLCEEGAQHEAAKASVYALLDTLTAVSASPLLTDALPTEADALRIWLDMLKRAFRDIAVLQRSPSSTPLFFESAAHAEPYTTRITVAKAITLFETADRLRTDLRLNMDARLATASLLCEIRTILKN